MLLVTLSDETPIDAYPLPVVPIITGTLISVADVSRAMRIDESAFIVAPVTEREQLVLTPLVPLVPVIGPSNPVIAPLVVTPEEMFKLTPSAKIMPFLVRK
ncbi:MAG: hypothetical protein EBZ07_03805 [Verrucomicrobia bacterium]|nr:hypothetical protein [Verrucomicrobiota bacterium]